MRLNKLISQWKPVRVKTEEERREGVRGLHTLILELVMSIELGWSHLGIFHVFSDCVQKETCG